MKKVSKKSGFTLIEILVVIGIIAVLAAIVIVAINPARQFAQARNTQRTSNVQTILNAVGQNLADNKGIFTCGGITIPTSAIAVPNVITSGTVPAAAKLIASTGGVDLSCVTPTYVPTLPFDPSASGASWTNSANYDTGYYIVQDNSVTGAGRITVFSSTTESALAQTNFISLTR